MPAKVIAVVLATVLVVAIAVTLGAWVGVLPPWSGATALLVVQVATPLTLLATVALLERRQR